MAAEDKIKLDTENMACPTCKARLQKRRTRKPDVCEMVCGGCGEVFDVCDLNTVEKLRNVSS